MHWHWHCHCHCSWHWQVSPTSRPRARAPPGGGRPAGDLLNAILLHRTHAQRWLGVSGSAQSHLVAAGGSIERSPITAPSSQRRRDTAAGEHTARQFIAARARKKNSMAGAAPWSWPCRPCARSQTPGHLARQLLPLRPMGYCRRSPPPAQCTLARPRLLGHCHSIWGGARQLPQARVPRPPRVHPASACNTPMVLFFRLRTETETCIWQEKEGASAARVFT